jgi:hypothetical protein
VSFGTTQQEARCASEEERILNSYPYAIKKKLKILADLPSFLDAIKKVLVAFRVLMDPSSKRD